MPISETKLAYIAGIFDGEGYIFVYRSEQKGRVIHQLTVGVKMCDPEAIGEIVESFGGCNTGYENEHAFCFRVTFVGRSAYDFLKAIRPYLRVKAEQADWAAECYEECYIGKGQRVTSSDVEKRDYYRAVLKDLKGWQPWEVCHS
jgi:hypothetical protein